MIKNHHTNPGFPKPANALSRRRFFRQTGATILATGFLTSCNGFLEDIIPKKNDPDPETPGTEPEDDKRDKTLAFFGDSLTIGAGGSTAYGNFVGSAMAGRMVVSDGIEGQIALSISIRQGGTPLKISIEDGKFNGTNAVKVTKLNNEFLSTPINTKTYTSTGTVAGVKCTITRTSSDKGESYTIKPELPSTDLVPDNSVFEIDASARLKTATQILWYGRNNVGNFSAADDIITALDDSIAYLSDPKRYIVLGVLLARPENVGTDPYNQVAVINEKLSAKYGENFIPMTSPTTAEMEAIGYTPTSKDQSELEQNNFPTGMRPDDQSDEIHLNDRGYRIVANRVIQKIKDLKY